MRFRASLLIAIVAFVTFVLLTHGDPTLEAQAARGKAALLAPAEAKEQAPATFRVSFDTSAGAFVVEAHREWAPLGADRFYNLVKRGFYDGCRFYRVTPLMAQFGINGDPEIAKVWNGQYIPDDPPRTVSASVGAASAREDFQRLGAEAFDASDTARRVASSAQSNKKGFVAFSQSGANRRSIQVIIHLDDNSTLDSQVTPFGQVVSGMNVVEKVYSGYGEPAPTGKGPMMTPLFAEGNAYLEREFPKLDYIKTATIAQ